MGVEKTDDYTSMAALALAEWKDTYETLHMWTQIVGKIRPSGLYLSKYRIEPHLKRMRNMRPMIPNMHKGSGELWLKLAGYCNMSLSICVISKESLLYLIRLLMFLVGLQVQLYFLTLP
jgi:hypothetical protein